MAGKHSRRCEKARTGVDRTKRYAPPDGISLLKSLPGVKFEESVEVAVRLGIDPKKTDQLVRGSVTLPKGTSCVRVTKPGKMGSGPAYCMDCFAEVLDQTQRKLDELRTALHSVRQSALAHVDPN